MARNDDSSVLFLDALADEVSGRWLVVGDDGTVAQALADRGAEVLTWNRYAVGERHAAPTPPSGTFDRAVLSLPRGRPAFAFALEMIASRLEPGAFLFVHGTNDGGVKTAHKSMGPWFEEVEKVDARKHGRLIRGSRSAAEARGSVDAYAEAVTLDLPLGPAEFIKLPGLFARGELDRGTALLLKALQSKGEKPVRRALDFASGMGVLGAGVKQRWPDAVIHALDADALAVEATRRALPDAQVALGDGYRALESIPDAGKYDLIVSNPPLHTGHKLNLGILEELVTQAYKLLHRRQGRLILVVQRQRPLPDLGGRAATLLADADGFRVWRI